MLLDAEGQISLQLFVANKESRDDWLNSDNMSVLVL